MATPEIWFKTMPPITKTYFVAALSSTALVSFNIVGIYYFPLLWELVLQKFQFWRLFTCFIFFGKFSLNFVFQIFLLVRYTRMLEEGFFTGNRGKAEMVFMMLFGAVTFWVISYLWGGLAFMGPSMMFMLLYVWSRKDPTRQVNFWGFNFLGWHFPFVMIVFSVLIGANPLLDIIGICVGHLYHFLMDIVPNVYNRTVLKTPEFMYNMFDQTNVHGRAQNWQRGAGYQLGQQ